MLHAFSIVPLEAESRGKFVILRNIHETYFVSAPLESHPYHANIVYSFLQEGGRGRAKMADPGFCTLLSQDWEILGGGFFETKGQERVLVLSGKSTAYGRYPVDFIKKNGTNLPHDLGLLEYSLEIR